MNAEQIDIINKIKENGSCYAFREDIKKYGNDKEFMLFLRSIASKSDSLLYLASDSLKKDKEFVLAEVCAHGISLRDASPELQADRDIVLAAVKSGSHYSRAAYNGYETTVLSMINSNFYEDAEIITEAIKNDGFILGEFARTIDMFDKDETFAENIASLDVGEINDDRNKKWCKLVYTNRGLFARLIKDKDFMLKVVSSYGGALAHASEELRDDEEVVLAAIKPSTGYAFKHASYRLREDINFGMKAISEQGMALEWANSQLRGDEKANLIALKSSLGAIRFADILRDDEEIMSAYCEIDGAWGRIATDRIKQKWDRSGKKWREQYAIGEESEIKKRKLAELIETRLESIELTEHITDGHANSLVEKQMQEALRTGDYTKYKRLFDTLSPEEQISCILDVQSRYRAEKSARTPLAQREDDLRHEEQISKMMDVVKRELDEPEHKGGEHE